MQTLAKTTKKLRRLSGDVILWKHFLLEKNSALLTSKLFNKGRPDRLHLLHNNVLRGIHPHQLSSGQYINSPTMKLLHENQLKIAWLMREQTIKQRLNSRPNAESLEKIGVLPSGSSSRSPIIVAQAHNLETSLKQASLNRKLRRRQSLSDVSTRYMRGVSADLNTGIAGLPAATVAVSPILAAKKVELEKQFTEKSLERMINARPSIDSVDTRLSDARQTALMVCPGVKTKIQSYERMLNRRRTYSS